MKHELDKMMDLIKDYKTGYGGVTDSFMRKELEMFAKDYHTEQLRIHDVVGRSELLKAFEQGETLFLDNTLKVEVITPESSVFVKDSRDNKMMWVEKGRLKRH